MRIALLAVLASLLAVAAHASAVADSSAEGDAQPLSPGADPSAQQESAQSDASADTPEYPLLANVAQALDAADSASASATLSAPTDLSEANPLYLSPAPSASSTLYSASTSLVYPQPAYYRLPAQQAPAAPLYATAAPRPLLRLSARLYSSAARGPAGVPQPAPSGAAQTPSLPTLSATSAVTPAPLATTEAASQAQRTRSRRKRYCRIDSITEWAVYTSIPQPGSAGAQTDSRSPSASVVSSADGSTAKTATGTTAKSAGTAQTTGAAAQTGKQASSTARSSAKTSSTSSSSIKTGSTNSPKPGTASSGQSKGRTASSKSGTASASASKTSSGAATAIASSAASASAGADKTTLSSTASSNSSLASSAVSSAATSGAQTATASSASAGSSTASSASSATKSAVTNAPTQSQFNEAVAGYSKTSAGGTPPTPSDDVYNSYIQNVASQLSLEEQAMFIANSIWETAGFQYLNEQACSNGSCTYGQYYGRGMLQLTWQSNYQSASQSLYGDSTLESNPDLAAQSPDSWRTALWYWMTIVHPSITQQVLDSRDLGVSVKLINGAIECPAGTAAQNRLAIYNNVLQVWGIGGTGSLAGC